MSWCTKKPGYKVPGFRSNSGALSGRGVFTRYRYVDVPQSSSAAMNRNPLRANNATPISVGTSVAIALWVRYLDDTRCSISIFGAHVVGASLPQGHICTCSALSLERLDSSRVVYIGGYCIAQKVLMLSSLSLSKLQRKQSIDRRLYTLVNEVATE